MPILFQTKRLRDSLSMAGELEIATPNKDMVIILPYDKNPYNELESVFFITPSCEAIKTIIGNKDPLATVLQKMEECGLKIENKESWLIRELPVQKINDIKIFPMLVDVSGIERKDVKITEVDIVNLGSYVVSDFYLSYLLAILSLSI